MILTELALFRINLFYGLKCVLDAKLLYMNVKSEIGGVV